MSRWVVADEIVRRFPGIEDPDLLVAWGAINVLTTRSEPVYEGGRLVGSVTYYDPDEVEALVAEMAATELANGGKRDFKADYVLPDIYAFRER